MRPSTFVLIALTATGASAVWLPSVHGLVVGAGLGFASGPASAFGGDGFAGLGGYVFVGREVAGWVTLGGRFEGYGYEFDDGYVSPDSAADGYDALYHVGFSARFHPLGGLGLRPYAGGDWGMYVRVNRDDDPGAGTYKGRVEPGVAARGGLEVFVVNSVAFDFGASYGIDTRELNRLKVVVGYVGVVFYF